MTVLVTGGAGFIGSHMVLELQDLGEKVVVLDDLSTGFRWAVPEGVPLVVGDFGDEKLLRDVLERYEIDEIIHFAAKTVVPDSVAAPLDYYLSNTAKARTLLACAVAGGVRRFIFSSTAAVYGDPESNPVAETATLTPLSPYGRSKLMVEWMLEDTAKAHGLSYVIFRYFNVAGADSRGRSGQSTSNASHLIKAAVQAALGVRPRLQIFGADYPTPDGTCLRDYIQVNDLVWAHMDGLQHLRAGGRSLTCNCGYGHGFSVLDVIETVKKASGVDFPTQLTARRPGDPTAVIASNERIKSELGWTPRYDNLELIVHQALDWERRLHNRRVSQPG
ncbi:UDP-glucose 4-epimerase GalE [Methylocystis sp. MJC1]|jgi:UDP-glucose 4-epimerase|uniref:UDP-glucose 4-epimerase GalE n=1 Tax=Methylocystis sp. MJC1 TaxID=2654282 RepID=UPI0013EA6A32|nr:UDP-glucose 4-epimerase GalE [Methylocystis sp. MJC1]KAF2989106.1 UDP-glucose 4-epimerase [Methylocystis sp. MJC1]MBU6528421.1 UDP-glucose 4-epimerase GalE [Methylocystis sp. MJC1]UZX11321.1 UDP-glucose 4-epimerase GalE [Methylocystis sp. MJC1]